MTIPKNTKLRIARPTNSLSDITSMYIDGLGFKLLGEFVDHEGFSGSILGHAEHSYHLEFTHKDGEIATFSPSKDNLLVFYVPDKKIWQRNCKNMLGAGFNQVKSYNPYWDKYGNTFEDIDKYRVVLENREWRY